MHEDGISLVLIGAVMSTFGSLAMISPGFAEWYVRSRGKGRLWARILGEDRAVVAMRSVFGPLTLVVGLAFVYLSGALS